MRRRILRQYQDAPGLWTRVWSADEPYQDEYTRHVFSGLVRRAPLQSSIMLLAGLRYPTFEVR